MTADESVEKDRQGWATSGDLWEKLKPLARQMRTSPTQAEDLLWQHLRKQQSGVKFRRQHSFERFIVDFYCRAAKLVIEVDGPVHHYTQDEDAIRQEYLESLGLRILRFSNDQVIHQTASVLDQIKRVLASSQ